MLQSPGLMPLVVLPVFQIFVINMPTLFLLQYVFKTFASILWKLYILNWYTFLIKALFLLLNGILKYQYIVCLLYTSDAADE